MNTYKIAVSAGDTVGEELIRQAKKLFSALEEISDVKFSLFEFISCAKAIDCFGTALREETCAGVWGLILRVWVPAHSPN